MKLWEAMKCLEEGKEVIHKSDMYSIESLDELWRELEFMDYDQIKFWEDGWEIYDDRYNASQQLKNLYNLLKELALGDCNEYDEYLDWESIDKKDRRDCMFYLYEQLKEMNKYYKLDK